MTKTIKFNTGRQYTAEGQVIVATLHDDGVVTFFDHSRGIDGEFKLADVDKHFAQVFSDRTVMNAYDRNIYQSTNRSRTDSMYRDSCNAR